MNFKCFLNVVVWFISCKEPPDAGDDRYCKNVNSKLLYWTLICLSLVTYCPDSSFSVPADHILLTEHVVGTITHLPALLLFIRFMGKLDCFENLFSCGKAF